MGAGAADGQIVQLTDSTLSGLHVKRDGVSLLHSRTPQTQQPVTGAGGRERERPSDVCADCICEGP